ncbi:MAG: transporter substrate-binding domain-containing protein [Pseudonocardiales bacterium]
MSITAGRTRGVLFAALLGLSACQVGGPVTGSAPTSAAPGIFGGPVNAETPPVNVGTLTDQPGFGELIPGSNVRAGFDIDLQRWLGNHAPHRFLPVHVDLTIDDRIRALQEDRVKLVVATFSITDERSKKIGFAGPYMITQQGVMVRAGDDRIQNMDDLTGKTVCTLSGSTSLSQLKEGTLKDQINVIEKKGYKECADQLLDRQVDAISTEAISLEGFAHRDPTRLSVVKNIRFGAQGRFGIGLRHGDVATCEVMTAKLKEFITSGSWDIFFDQHFPGLQSELYKPDPNNLNPCE